MFTRSTKPGQVNESDLLTFKFCVHCIFCVHVLNQLLFDTKYKHLYSVLQEVLLVSDVRREILIVKAESSRVAVVLKRHDEHDSLHAVVGGQDLLQGNAEALGRARDSLHANVGGLLLVSFGDLVAKRVLESLESNAGLPVLDPLWLHLSTSEDKVRAAPRAELMLQLLVLRFVQF